MRIITLLKALYGKRGYYYYSGLVAKIAGKECLCRLVHAILIYQLKYHKRLLQPEDEKNLYIEFLRDNCGEHYQQFMDVLNGKLDIDSAIHSLINRVPHSCDNHRVNLSASG
ncbi:hypothetical protein QIT50_gp21 [Pyrobaculum spherical virus 2]|uniref:Uncharacterized protein n=1 Tax=Pyrobaculum spherical virus 2 TaxID=2730632 RepID=A0A6M3VZZ2_9VIRU|nr:hypothetical protein QIT50_gp21 [Pyrobaculum spherical virus 2]QJF12433.1 hypothetical protein PSV2_gp21 [Pyrobaculum spherical virus 2]